ncbi:MAG: hypothetical protein U5K32_09835 [Bacteroidales bacterium]|nr:hypothetical protein [Bacteroidales bacterium]
MKKFLFILLLLCSIHFWGLSFLPRQFHYITDTVSLLIMGFAFISTLGQEKLRFRNAIIVFFVGIIVNIVAAYIYHGQRIIDTFLIFGSFYFILFYFILHQLKIERRYLENVIIVFAILYSVFYLVQFYVYPLEIVDSQMKVDRGTIRLRIIGNGFLVLAYFMLLNRYMMKQRWTNIILLGFFFIILLKGGFRTLTFMTILLTILMYVKLAKYSKNHLLTAVLAIVLLAGLAQSRTTSAIIKNMIYTTQDQVNQGDEYIRLRQLDFFVNRYMEKGLYYLTGGGFPAGENDYNQKMRFFQENYGFYWVDLGIIGFYFVIGALALIGLLWYSLKASFIKLKPEYSYLNFYFLYLILVSFTTMEIYRAGVFAVEGLVLYLIDVSIDEKDEQTGNKEVNTI